MSRRRYVAAAVAAHTSRLRDAGGKRTSVELDAQAVADLRFLATKIDGNTSIIICAALRHACKTLEHTK